MANSRIASRYAKAVYELAVDNRTQEKVFDDLRMLEAAVAKDHDIHEFLVSPMITTEDRVTVLTKTLENKGLSKEVFDLVILLARKDRLALLHDIVHAYEQQSDSANGVGRGVVRSATVLGQADRTRVEETVERVLKKKAILSYKVDPTVIGGLVAQVGSYTFDDSISAHLQRMNDELKRRTV
jgi:F-type H+-transporting ATPase subunit delta